MSPPPSPPRLRPWQRLWLGLFLLLSALLWAAALYNWRLRCEGFGCVGVGIVWMAWAVVAAGHLLLGLCLRRLAALQAAPARRLRGVLQALLLAQSGLLLLLAAYWLLH